MMRKSIFGTLGWLMLAASLLFMFFIVLSGLTNKTPLSKTYFLRADTSTIDQARPITQWTYFYICGDKNRDCGKPVPALPFGYAWKHGGNGAPGSLRGSHAHHTTSTHFYYLLRFGWVFFLMGLVLAALGFLTGLFYCVRILNKFTGVILTFALFWYTLGVTLITSEFVQARNRFHTAGLSAKLGKYGFGFMWAAWAALLLSIIFFFIAGKKDGTNMYASRRQERRASRGSAVSGTTPVTTTRGRFDYVPFYKKRRQLAQDDVMADKETV